MTRVTRCGWEWRAVRDVRAMPAGTVFVMDQKLAIFADRRLPDDYYATDWYGLSITGGGEEWIGRMIEAADVVVVTERLVIGMTAANVETLVRTGRPVYFPKLAEEQDFNRKFGTQPLTVWPRGAETPTRSR